MSVLTRVQSNPEIGADDSAFVTELVTRAQDFVRDYCRFPGFPSLSQGYTRGRAGADTDLTGLSTGYITLYLNGSYAVTITLDLANCDTGANTAAELQTQIRAVDQSDWGFDEVTVTFASTQYQVTSGRYGEGSSVIFDFEEAGKHLAKALGFTPVYGGVSVNGMSYDEQIESATVEIVEQLYRRVGVEGLQNYSLHQGEFGGAVHQYADPVTLARLRAKRRLW